MPPANEKSTQSHSSASARNDPAASRPLPPPATGSANPAASFPALWSYILPALDHFFRSPYNDNERAPSVDIGFYSGIHSACYNYFTSPRDIFAPGSPSARIDRAGNEFYDHLDKYFGDVARELILSAPTDDSALLDYVLRCFTHFSSSAKSTNRLLNYFNRHYVTRCVDEDKGWLRLSDIFNQEQAVVIVSTRTKETFAAQIQEKRLEELMKWGFTMEGSSVSLAEAEARAEAASAPDRIIPISSLAHRRFRTDFLEPLINVSKIGNKPKAKKKIPKSAHTPLPVALAPKGRLGRAVEQFISSQLVAPELKTQALRNLSTSLTAAGVRQTHSLRKRIDMFLKS